MPVRTILITLAVALAASSPLQAGNYGERGRGYDRAPGHPVRATTVYAVPTAAEAEDMLYMREE